MLEMMYENDINNSKNTWNEFIESVKNDVKSIKIKATKSSSKSTVNITRNSNFKVGLNKVLVSVTSESGLIRNYRIYVTKESEWLYEK